MQVKITCLRGKGLNYQVEIDGKMILENVRHPLPMLAGRLIAKGHDRSTVIDFQVNEGAVMRSAPLSELTELPRPRLELHRPFQTARRAAYSPSRWIFEATQRGNPSSCLKQESEQPMAKSKPTTKSEAKAHAEKAISKSTRLNAQPGDKDAAKSAWKRLDVK